MRKYFNSLPDLALLISILLSWILNSLAPIVKIIYFPLSLVGVTLAVTGFILAVMILNIIRAKKASTDVVKTSDALITSGIYSVSRNPFYVCCVIMVFGVAIAFGSVSAFFGPILYVLIVDLVVIPYEEKQLQNKFGKKYDQYKQSVRRWL